MTKTNIYDKGESPILTEQMIVDHLERLKKGEREFRPRVRYLSSGMYKEYKEYGPEKFFEMYPWMA